MLCPAILLHSIQDGLEFSIIIVLQVYGFVIITSYQTSLEKDSFACFVIISFVGIVPIRSGTVAICRGNTGRVVTVDHYQGCRSME